MNQYFVTFTVEGYPDSIRTAFVDCEVGKTASETQYKLKDAISEQHCENRYRLYIRSVSKIN